jgi:hypothetical protein
VQQHFRRAEALLDRLTGRQRADRLGRGQRAGRGVAIEHADRAEHLGDHVRVLAVTGQRDVPWTGAGRRDRGERRRRRRDRPGRAVDLVDEHLIEAEIRDVEKTAGRIGLTPCACGPLPILVDAGSQCWTNVEAGFSVPSAAIGRRVLPPP